MNSFSQEKVEFRPGVQIFENEINPKYKTPSSILFVFGGGTHSIRYYLDLKKEIRTQFRKHKKKEFKKFKLKFSFDLKSKKPLKNDLATIPSSKYHYENFEIICFITISDFNGWDNHLIEKRKQNYLLNLKLVNWKTNQTMLKLKLNVNSYYTILTQNKNSSRLIVDAIIN